MQVGRDFGEAIVKNKITSVIFVSVLLSSSAFAHTANYKKAEKESIGGLDARTIFLEKQVRSLQNKITILEKTDKQLASKLNLDLLVELYAHGPAVVTSPALGVRRSAEDASDLMVNLSTINEDLILLQIRKRMDNYARENNVPIPERPIIALSGGVEGQVTNVRDYNNSEKTDINLSTAELDVIGEAGPWATAAMIVSYDDKRIDGDRRVNNSRLKIGRGFLTVGQLNRCPLYFTIGQIYAPFGNFGSDMVTSSSTKILGRMKDRMIVLGYYWDGLQAQIYGYPGEVKSGKNIFGHTGFNLGYEYTKNKFKLSVAGSMIGNLAESDGMQDNIFAKGYLATTVNEMVNRRVAGIDGRIRVGYHPVTLRAEYVGAVGSFDKRDLGFNNRNARPQALHIEGAVEFNIKGKPNNFAVAYGHTWDALALKLPRESFSAEYDVALVKNTILSIEYRHDINYGWNDFAGGRGIITPITVANIGRHKNTILANLGVYF